MDSITLQGKVIISGQIEAVTGLHIGGAAAGLDIGGIDNPIIRHAVTRQPYIPGSSLRGKMRCLLDRHGGKRLNKNIGKDVRIHECDSREEYARCEVCQLFGITPGEHRDFGNLMPTRLIVRDAYLLNGDKSKRGSAGWLEAAKTDMPYTEVKVEVAIDRITSAAVPRQNERVPAGAVFEPLELVVSLYSREDVGYLPSVFKALELLEDDYLGGYGSRGSGKIRFRNLNVTLKSRDYYERKAAILELGKELNLPALRAADYTNQIQQAIGR
jgi:CRISPR-associated protein Csm3